jgi:chromosome segregation ATPase
VDTGKARPSPKSPPEHPAMVTHKHLSSIYQHLQACFNGVNACKLTSDKFEHAYRQESYKLKELRKQYDILARDNQYYEKLFPQYDEIHQDMQKRIQSSEDSNREYESRIKELERRDQEGKEELHAAFIRIGELEEQAVTSPQSPAPQSPINAKRRRHDGMDGPHVSCEPEKKRGRPRKHRKVMSEVKIET